eukprot:10170415-Karenia_brevis.AAC.1
MRDLKGFHSTKLAEMGDPEECWQQWVRLITSFTTEWKMLVKEFMYTTSAIDKNKVAAASDPFMAVFTCHLCSTDGRQICFSTCRAYCSHLRAKHGQQNVVKQFIGADCVCPACGVPL